jgi:hypothetical protein
VETLEAGGSGFLGGRCRGRVGHGRWCGSGVAVARDRDDDIRCWAASGPDSARASSDRRCSGPTGDGDEGAEGKPAQVRATALGAEAAAWNEKSNGSGCELCGERGERSCALI